MYLSSDVGSRAPLGLAWGLGTREQDRESLVTVLGAHSGGRHATGEQLFEAVAQLPLACVTFYILGQFAFTGKHAAQFL